MTPGKIEIVITETGEVQLASTYDVVWTSYWLAKVHAQAVAQPTPDPDRRIIPAVAVPRINGRPPN